MKRLLSTFLLCFIAVVCCLAGKPDKGYIRLQHRSKGIKTPSCYVPVVATLEYNNSISLCFSGMLSDLEISVRDVVTEEIIYITSVDISDENSTFSIPLNGISEGEYKLLLLNSYNEISGDFIIESQTETE